MISLKSAKERSADKEQELENRVVELNDILKEKDHDILILGKKIMKVENDLDDKTEGLAAATVSIEEAEKQQLVNEEEVAALQRRSSLLEDDVTRSDSRLQVESAKLHEAAAAAEAVEIQRKLLEAKNMVNEERIDSLEQQIAVASEVAQVSTRNNEEISRKFAMTNVELENRVVELNDVLKVKDHDILILGKKIMKVENDLDDKIEGLAAATVSIEEAEKYQEICVELEQTFNEMAGY